MNIKPNMVIKCETKEEAEKLCYEVLRGKTKRYIEDWIYFWDVYRSETCYKVSERGNDLFSYGTYTSFAEDKACIVRFSDLYTNSECTGEVKWLVVRRDGHLKYFTENVYLSDYVKVYGNEILTITNISKGE